ncbi:HVO_2072 family ArtA-dependent S-layer glycoprotein, partial [Halobacterium hubeiense]
MTDTTNKLRAVFLTALMIGSVFTAGIAFTGTAAAANASSPNNIQVGGQDSIELSEPTTQTEDVTFDISNLNPDNSGQTVEFTVSLDAANFEFSDANQVQVSNDVSISQNEQVNGNGEITFNLEPSSSGVDAGTITVDGAVIDATAASAGASSDVTVTVDDSGANDDTTASTTLSSAVTVAESTGPADGRSDSDGDGKYETVGPNSVVYQGEGDLDFANDLSASSFERASGSNEGVPLEMPIPSDQTTGTYDGPSPFGNGGLTVSTPRVTTLEVQNNAGSDVSGGILNTNQDNAVVEVEYNYDNAEDIELTVEDEDGLDVTDEIVDSAATRNGDGSIAINPSAVDAGEYTFEVAGVDDLDFGDASESVSVTISSSQTASLSLAEDEVVQGANLQYTVENSPEGNFHAVTVDSSDFRDGVSTENVANLLRNVGDTTETGVVNDNGAVETDLENADIDNVDYAYAIVEIDGGNGVGSIETQYLDDSSVDVDLYPASADAADDGYAPDGSLDNVTTLNGLETDDDESFEVTEGEVSLDSPTGTYVVGSEVDINGTANEGTDEVALYARDNNDFELVTIDDDRTIEVDSDDTFEETDVVISGDTDGNNLLSLPGTYRLGIIDATDADTNSDGTVEDTLTTSDFNSGISSTSSLTVTDTELNGSFVTYNGQIASDDAQVDVEGTAPGKDELAVAFVDSRGNAEAYDITVDSDGTFTEEDLDISTLNEGSVSAHIISSGRDGVFGDGVENSASAFADTIMGDYASGASTGNQVRDRILANSVDDTASDDLIVTETFRLSDGLTTIESVSGVESGGTLTVEGQTNRVPDDNTITVELLDQDDESVTIASTDEWGTDGQWSVEMDLANVEPGEYTLESDDGDNTDRQDIEIVEESQETTQQPTTQTTEEPTTQEPTTTEESTTAAPTTTEESAGTTEDTSGESGSGIPGFGMGIALVAVLG